MTRLLDISFACVYWALARDVPAQRIFQSVASGLLGKESYAGGWGTAALGLGLHFLMTLTMAAAYYLASQRLPVLWRRPLASGAAYGSCSDTGGCSESCRSRSPSEFHGATPPGCSGWPRSDSRKPLE